MSIESQGPLESKGEDMPLINISYTADGDFDYDKPSCSTRRGQTIEWFCQGEGYYAIHFGWESPFEYITYQAPLGKRISLRIPDEARRARYKYTVVVVDTDRRQIFVDDPEFIIKG
jgi:hypothetical protein